MNDKTLINEASKDNQLVITNDSGIKEYISYSKTLLDDFKMMQNIIQDAEGPDISILIKVAQKNLTTTAMQQSDEMINQLQLNFNDKTVQIFIEQSITLITSVETADYLYGNMIEVEGLRKYISAKVTKMTTIRCEKLIKQLQLIRYEDRKRLNFIVQNLNLCIKVFDYAWDICQKNIKALQQSNYIVNTLISHRVKLGLDNYNIEMLKGMIGKNVKKIREYKLNSKTDRIDFNEVFEEAQSVLDNEVIDNIIVESIENNEDYNNELTSEKSIIQVNKVNKDSVTERFIDITNSVIKEVTESSSNDFLNIALQKFYSIIGAIETMNYLKGNIVNKTAVAQNISVLLSDMIFTNYTAISRSWREITEKSLEDYEAYSKEIKKYCDILIESYEMCESNIDALKKCIIMESDLYSIKDKSNLSNDEQYKLNTTIEEHISKVKKVDSEYSFERKSNVKEIKKKKSIWAKIFK